MFHEEHTIPVSLIFKELTENSRISTKKDIKELLESMHICIILKEEDREINKKSGTIANRRLDFNENVKNIYYNCGITLLPYEQFP